MAVYCCVTFARCKLSLTMKNFSWKDWLLAIWSLLTVLFAITTIVWGVQKTWQWLGSNSSNIASWVQAFGSVGAILGASYVANRQYDRENKRLDSEMRRRLRSSYAAIAVPFNAFEKATMANRPWNGNELRLECELVLSQLRECLEDIRRISFEKSNSKDVATSLAMRHALIKFIQHISSHSESALECGESKMDENIILDISTSCVELGYSLIRVAEEQDWPQVRSTLNKNKKSPST